MAEYNPNKSIYIPDKELWGRIENKARRPDIDRSVSQIAVRLFEMWLRGDILPYPESNIDEQA